MNVLLFGATGIVGSAVLTQCLADDRVSSVLAIGRRPAKQNHEKLRQIEHADFLDYSNLRDELSRTDLCVFCLAAYQSQVSEADYETITVGYLEALVRILEEVRPSVRFCLFSAQGASPSQRSRLTFARVKGRAENVLTESRIAHRHIFRPGLIVPDASRRGWWYPAGLLEIVFRIFPGAASVRPISPG